MKWIMHKTWEGVTSLSKTVVIFKVNLHSWNSNQSPPESANWACSQWHGSDVEGHCFGFKWQKKQKNGRKTHRYCELLHLIACTLSCWTDLVLGFHSEVSCCSEVLSLTCKLLYIKADMNLVPMELQFDGHSKTILDKKQRPTPAEQQRSSGTKLPLAAWMWLEWPGKTWYVWSPGLILWTTKVQTAFDVCSQSVLRHWATNKNYKNEHKDHFQLVWVSINSCCNMQ